jgi:regulator of sigma E protease
VDAGLLGATVEGRLGITPWFYAPQIGILDPSSPAYQEGLRTGDVITSINGEPLETVAELERMLTAPGDALIRLTYLRARPGAGPFASDLWYVSHHAQLLPGKGSAFRTGILPANTFVRRVEPGSAAEAAGLRPGDRVLDVDGHTLTTWETLEHAVASAGSRALTLRVQSPGEPPRNVSLHARATTWRDVYGSTHRRVALGARPYALTFTPPSEPIRGRFTHAIDTALRETTRVVGLTWAVLARAWRPSVSAEPGVGVGLGSLGRVTEVAGTSAAQGSAHFVFLMGVVSVNLALVNLLPLPRLDLGRWLLRAIETLLRRRVDPRAQELATAAGAILLGLWILLALRGDLLPWGAS